MLTILLVLHVFVALALIGFILIQHGKGADMGAAFGAGASATVFGSQGSGSFLTRATAVLATIFFVNSLVLSLPMIHGRGEQKQSIMERVQAAQPALAIPEDAVPADDLPVAPAEDVPSVPGEPASSAEVPGESDVPTVPVEPASESAPIIPTVPAE